MGATDDGKGAPTFLVPDQPDPLRYSVEGSYSGFLQDLELLWSHADRLAHDDSKYIGYQVRYALIASSLHSQAGNVPPRLLQAAVEKGI